MLATTVNATPSKQLAKDLSQVDLLKSSPPLADEPILTPNPKRFVLFPIKYHEVSCRLSFNNSSFIVLINYMNC